MDRSKSARRRVTIADVAADAGVSRSTVSLVMQDSHLVAAATRDRVRASVEKLGYVYHRGAASLRTRRTNTIGLIVTSLANPFFADLSLGIEQELGPAGYVVFLATHGDDVGRQDAAARTLLEYQADGVLLVPAVDTDPDLIGRLRASDTPHVLLTRYLPEAPASFVGADDRAGGRFAGEHLSGHGCRTVGYLGGPERAIPRRHRLAAVVETVTAAGGTVPPRWRIECDTTSTAGYQAMRAALATGSVPDGLVCHSDAVAFGAMRALAEAGLRVGRDCRVVGYDDVEDAAVWEPALTSVSVEPREMGRAAARLLLDQLAAPDGDTVHRVRPPRLAVRESCGCPTAP